MPNPKKRPAASADTVGHPFPYLPESTHPMVWVAALLRDQAILIEFSKEERKFWGHRNLALSTGMSTALNHLRKDVRESAKVAQEVGVILFCHAETTAVTGGAA